MERVCVCMYVCTCLHACVYVFMQLCLCVSKGVYVALCHTLLFLVHVRLSALSVMYAGFLLTITSHSTFLRMCVQ